MSAARKTQSRSKIEVRAALSARLDLLLAHAITLDQFDADVTRTCHHDPEEIWTVLGLLDQYHRLGKLPTELFRALKRSADQRGLGRRGLVLPESTVGTAMGPAMRDDPPTRPAESAHPAVPAPATPAPAPVSVPVRVVPTLAPVHTPATASAPVSDATMVAAMVTPTAMAPASAARRSPVAPVAIGVGTTLGGRFLLEADAGGDERGPVYLAIDRRRGDVPLEARRVALQILHSGEAATTNAMIERRQEFRRALSLSHPNILSVRELDQDDTAIFQTMDWVTGESLMELLARRQGKALPRATALAIIRDIGAALIYAHEQGVVHGDLQPQNVLISATGEVRLRGFCALGAHSNYASCEQLEGRVADRRDDLFALACIGYQLLSGAHPFGLVNAATARGRGLFPVRPIMLTRTQWQTLRIGLAWRRENRTVGVAWWLAHMRLSKATARLPALETLAALPPLKRSVLKPMLLVGCFAAAVAVAASLDRLPNAATVTAGVEGLHRVANGATSLLAQLGDWLSPTEPARIASAPVVTPPPVVVQTINQNKGAHDKNLRLASADRGMPIPPAPASITPVAKPDPTRIDLSADNYTVLPGESSARVVVRRHGTLQGDVSFVWWTEAASAKPDRDFIAWGRRAEQIPAGHATVTLLVPIVSDATRSQSRVFYVAIGETGGGAELGDNERAAILMPGGG